MTDGIRGSWFRNRHWWNGRTGQEVQALKGALHTAVGGLRWVLRDTPPECRSGVGYRQVLGRLGEHGVVIGLRDGLLDVPAELSLESEYGGAWASRTVLHGLAHDLVLDEQLRGILGAEPVLRPDDLDAVVTAGSVLGSSAVWRTRVAEPLAVLDELWAAAGHAVLRRDPAASELLRNIDVLLPASLVMSTPTDPPSVFLDALRTRIEHAEIAWDVVEIPLLRKQLPGPRAAGGASANPWLSPPSTVSPGPSESPAAADPGPAASASPGAAHQAMMLFWDWARRLWRSLHDCVVSGLMPVAAAIYWDAVARALAMLAPAAPAAPAGSEVPSQPGALPVPGTPAAPKAPPARAAAPTAPAAAPTSPAAAPAAPPKPPVPPVPPVPPATPAVPGPVPDVRYVPEPRLAPPTPLPRSPHERVLVDPFPSIPLPEAPVAESASPAAPPTASPTVTPPQPPPRPASPPRVQAPVPAPAPVPPPVAPATTDPPKPVVVIREPARASGSMGFPDSAVAGLGVMLGTIARPGHPGSAAGHGRRRPAGRAR
ncbi:hypothetical protein OG216_20695 [Streptomycetaceae bacterium NBC_01309]